MIDGEFAHFVDFETWTILGNLSEWPSEFVQVRKNKLFG